jgi:hypothetical protein
MSMTKSHQHSCARVKRVDEPQVRALAQWRFLPAVTSKSHLLACTLKQKCLEMPVDKRVLSLDGEAKHRERFAMDAYNEKYEFEMAR